MMAQEHVPVLIVGAGGAGLSLSLLLRQQGIASTLIERRSDISWVPRARNLNFRTLEVFHGLRLEEEVRAAGTSASRIFRKPSLASPEQEELFDPTQLQPPDLEEISPEPFMLYCPQSRLEPILRAAAKHQGCDVRYGTELVSFTQEDAGVTATLEEHATGRSSVVHADYLIAADGAHSHIRETLGIKSQGYGALPEYIIFVYFRAPWQPLIAGHEADAIQTMPGYKGLGLNTAIQSVQNLAWKLAAVIRGQVGQELLATYQVERHPVGRFAAHQSLTGPAAAVLPKGMKSELLPEKEELPIFYPIVGYRYRSQAILSEDAAPPEQEIALLDREELTGQPGTRVPHLWLERQGQRISTLDLLDGRFVLLTGAGGTDWREAAEAVAEKLGIALSAYRIGPDADLLDLENGWQTKMGVSSEGAVLVRPDGFVAWRTSTSAPSPESSLVQVFSSILCRSTEHEEAEKD
jgi:2-polyprenyl-6-methoxyphenol hydroxylase-like FAD-dependent oxidoreductase